MIHAIYLFPACVAALAVGHYLGCRGTVRSLKIGPDHRGVTGAHCPDGEFYYLVPERTFNGLIGDHYHLKNLGKTTYDRYDPAPPGDDAG